MRFSGGVLGAVQISLVDPAVKINSCFWEFTFKNCLRYAPLPNISPSLGNTFLMLKLVRKYQSSVLLVMQPQTSLSSRYEQHKNIQEKRHGKSPALLKKWYEVSATEAEDCSVLCSSLLWSPAHTQTQGWLRLFWISPQNEMGKLLYK